MSFHLKTRAPLAGEILRVLRAEIHHGLGATRPGSALMERIHDVRTCCKKIRAGLRLLRAVAPKFAARENRRFRAIAAAMSPLRDADALLAAHAVALAAPGRQDDGRKFPALHRRLLDYRRTRGSPNRLARELQLAAARLRHAGHRLRQVQLPPLSFASIARSFAKNYRAARRAMHAAMADGGDEAHHRWRRRTKSHGYHLRLLVEAWPPVMKNTRHHVETLGELLGDDHDLAMLRRFLCGREAAALAANPVRAFLRLIETRRFRLQAEARWLGARIFADRPRAVRRRLAVWWKNQPDSIHRPGAKNRELKAPEISLT